MSNRTWLLALIATFSLLAEAKPVEDLPRPVFTLQREFLYQEAQPAIVLSAAIPSKVAVFKQAAVSCGLNLQEVAFQVSSLLNFNESPMLNSIKRIYPDLREQTFADVLILIDDFGPSTSKFRSFYMRATEGKPATISLDCSLSTRSQWPALLAHELSHHLNRERNLAPWMDEMLAQVLETENTSGNRIARFEHLAKQSSVPGFFTNHSVFHSSEQYASTLLFGFYLRGLFGSSILSELNQNIQNLQDLTQRLSDFAKSKARFDWLQNLLNPKSLIRHFQLALVVNAPTVNKGPLYQVPLWTGFQMSREILKEKVFLPPGGSLKLPMEMKDKIQNLPPELEAYWIAKKGFEFQIVKIPNQIQNPENWKEHHFILVNTSEDRALEIRF